MSPDTYLVGWSYSLAVYREKPSILEWSTRRTALKERLLINYLRKFQYFSSQFLTGLVEIRTLLVRHLCVIKN